jgi:hypothetical protein
MTLRTYRFTFSGAVTIDDAALVQAALGNVTVEQQGQDTDEIDDGLVAVGAISDYPEIHLQLLVNKVFMLELAALRARFAEVLPGALIKCGPAELDPSPWTSLDAGGQ